MVISIYLLIVVSVMLYSSNHFFINNEVNVIDLRLTHCLREYSSNLKNHTL